MGLLLAIVLSAQPVGFAASGWLADAHSVSFVLMVSGAAIVAIGGALATSLLARERPAARSPARRP